MGRRTSGHPDDLDVAALYGDALLNVTAWSLWDLVTGEPAEGAHTLEAKRVLESALRLPGGMAHPGLLHFYIHLMEMSPTPEAALEAADALRGLIPDGGHLLHMPTHIDVLLGDYERVIADNERAITADERYAVHAGRVNFYALYRAHDHHFRIYGAMFAGCRATAVAAADALAASLPEELLRVDTPPMADWLESFVPMRVHVRIRFGLWQEIIAEPLPADPELFCVTTALIHYAKVWRSPPPRASRKPRMSATGSSRRSRACPTRGIYSTTRRLTSWPSRARCSTARSNTGRGTTTPRGRICGARSNSTTRCPTTSPGDGCSQRVTRTGRCSSSRARSSAPARCTPPT